MNFKDKVVIVTGSSAGIGAAIAIKFAEAGAKVVITGRDEEKLKDIAEQCTSLGSIPLVIRADVTNNEEAKRIIIETTRKFGHINVLVNNAGIFRMAGVKSGNLLKSYDEVINTNLRAVMYLTHLAAPHLIATKGNIINISSVASKKVMPGMTGYAVSKAALTQFSKYAAVELAPSGVRVNTITPGPVETGIPANAAPAELQNLEMKIPLNRVSLPEEVAHLTVFLASDKAVGITGSDYVLDNGVLLG